MSGGDGRVVYTYRSRAEFRRGDRHVGRRLIFKTAGLQDILYAWGVLQIRIGLLQGRDGVVCT